MKDVAIRAESFMPKPKAQWENQLEGGFGIFQGKEPKHVTLKFNAFRAPWIREQIWHPDQKLEEVGDGSVTLAFPVCHFPEVKMKILQFGADVEVLEPTELREEIGEEIQNMKCLYA
jgi:predicted DNA-binding transcriptional regulator YafY